MRKWDIYKNINRNSTLLNHFHSNEERTTSDTPIVMGQLWLQKDTPQVEIIELDSDDSEPELNEGNNFDYENIWDYINKERFTPLPEQEFYQANKKAREKRRMLDNNYNDNSDETVENQSPPNNVVFTSFYDFTNDLSVKDNAIKHQANCFTIINKPFNASESSSDERLNTPENLYNNGNPYDSEMVAFDDDIDAAKRTIWIYSFRNKRLLSEHDFEMVNIPSQDSESSTSCSLENFPEERKETKDAYRVSSPIPATYVPRLKLSTSPTLPTVTEITEPTKNTKEESPESEEITCRRQKCINNWLVNEVTNTHCAKEENKQSNANVINWMCLSPRERRRRFKHTHTGPTYQPKLPVLIEIPSCEPMSHISLPEESSNKIRTVAEINIVKHKSEEGQTDTPKRSLLKCKTRIKDQLPEIAVEDIEIANEKTDNNLLHKPRIKCMGIIDHANKAKITDPIEKLRSNKWIQEEVRKETNAKESDTREFGIMPLEDDTSRQSPVQYCAGRKLWARNMTLLKPVEWTEFMPIADSVPSLHLSIEGDSTKRTWLSKLAKCFRCFK